MHKKRKRTENILEVWVSVHISVMWPGRRKLSINKCSLSYWIIKKRTTNCVYHVTTEKSCPQHKKCCPWQHLEMGDIIYHIQRYAIGRCNNVSNTWASEPPTCVKTKCYLFLWKGILLLHNVCLYTLRYEVQLMPKVLFSGRKSLVPINEILNCKQKPPLVAIFFFLFSFGLNLIPYKCMVNNFLTILFPNFLQ